MRLFYCFPGKKHRFSRNATLLPLRQLFFAVIAVKTAVFQRQAILVSSM